MVAKFVGKRYKLHANDNFENYLKTIEVSEDKIKVYLSLVPSMDLQVDGDTYTINSHSSAASRGVSFKIGQEFVQKLIDGREVKTTFTIDGNKLIETHKDVPFESSVIREFSDNEVKIIMKAGDVVATRIYKAE